jgi:hypothetical protein
MIIGVGLIWLTIVAVNCSKNDENKSTQEEHAISSARVVDVDNVVRYPDQYKGLVAVRGTVARVEEAKAAFALSCEDACIALPVAYGGKMPAVGNEVTVYGEVVRGEGEKYVFAAQDVKTE